MALDRIVNIVLRAAELVFATIVAGVTGQHLHQYRHASDWSQGRFIYTEVVAALSMFFALIWLVPFSWAFVHWPVDLILSLAWWASFGLLVNMLGDSCGYVFNWSNVHPVHGDQCGKFKADIAFAFLSALLWLVSALLGIFWVRGRERTAQVDAAHRQSHRRWYRRSRV
ncbi:membrane-associating domain-containing protein [Trichoderma chlorosporum]